MPSRRGNKWTVRIRFPEPHGYQRPTFDTELEAHRWEIEAYAAKDAGQPPPELPKANPKTTSRIGPFISDNFDKLWGGKRSEQSALENARQLEVFFGRDHPLSLVATTGEYDRYMQYRRTTRGNSDKTLNRHTSCYSRLMKEAKRQGLIDALPDFQFRRETRGRVSFMSEEIFDQAVRYLHDAGHHQSAKTVEFLVYTGARPGKDRSELQRLEWSDIQNGLMVLDGKTGPRRLPLTKRASAVLAWCREQGYSKPFPQKYTTFLEHWTEMRSALGRTSDADFTPYICRHTCASWMAIRGVDIRRIKDWMGHSTITTTMIYAHLLPDSFDKCLEALDA